jgi:hypothetical protein
LLDPIEINIQVHVHRMYSGLGTDRADTSYVIPVANNPSNYSTSSNDGGITNWSLDDDEVIVQPPSQQKSHTKVALDTVISEFTLDTVISEFMNLLTQYPSIYKEISLAHAMHKVSVSIL